MLSCRTRVIEGEIAVAVVDVLPNALLLRQASQKAAAAAKAPNADKFNADQRSAYQRHQRAEGYVRELMGLITSRARHGGFDDAEVLKLANDVLEGRAVLPEGLEAQEAA